MTTITPELRRAVEREGRAQLVDPETNITYVVILLPDSGHGALAPALGRLE